MTHGTERVVGDIIKATFKNPKESAYMAKFALASRAASQRRRKAEDAGEHIPPFLIASITSQCNLHCAGCYSRCNHATVDDVPVRQLTSEEWLRIFEEADELGISFILLAGGEPMIRRDIIEAAGKRPNILFPVFTNGSFMDERYFDLFDHCRNLVPIMSIEGEKEITDARRGTGIYDRLIANMDELHRRGLIFGASVTVTTRNIREVHFLPGRRKEQWWLCGGWPGLLPHQLPRRRGALPVLTVFRRQRQGRLPERGPALTAVHGAARWRPFAGRPRGWLCALRKTHSGGSPADSKGKVIGCL